MISSVNLTESEIDAKSTPPKSDSEEFKKMKLEMELLRAELVNTKLKLEEQLPSNDDKSKKDTGEIMKPTIDSNAENLKNINVTAESKLSDSDKKSNSFRALSLPVLQASRRLQAISLPCR